MKDEYHYIVMAEYPDQLKIIGCFGNLNEADSFALEKSSDDDLYYWGLYIDIWGGGKKHSSAIEVYKDGQRGKINKHGERVHYDYEEDD